MKIVILYCAKLHNNLRCNMISIKIKFQPSAEVGREGRLFFQIINERKKSKLYTDYYIFPEEWCFNRSTILPGINRTRSERLERIRQCIRWDKERLSVIIRKLESDFLEFSTEDIIEEFKQWQRSNSLTKFMSEVIQEKYSRHRYRTGEIYRAALRRFKNFLSVSGHEDILMYRITPRLIEAYENWLICRGVCRNTSSFYMRSLQATYNRAVKEGLTEDRKPFNRVYKGVCKTEKRALSIDMIRRIKEFDFSAESDLDYARDMFMLSLMLRGMSIVDMAFLKKSDLHNGHITYHRSKTRQRLTVEWLPEMQAILDKYPPNPTDYLLPILTRQITNPINAYRNQGSKINRGLKEVARRVGLNMNLTLYSARHSWASLARAQGIALSVISEGMGHDSEKTTRIYLAELDTSAVDSANREILSIL